MHRCCQTPYQIIIRSDEHNEVHDINTVPTPIPLPLHTHKIKSNKLTCDTKTHTHRHGAHMRLPFGPYGIVPDREMACVQRIDIRNVSMSVSLPHFIYFVVCSIAFTRESSKWTRRIFDCRSCRRVFHFFSHSKNRRFVCVFIFCVHPNIVHPVLETFKIN